MLVIFTIVTVLYSWSLELIHLDLNNNNNNFLMIMIRQKDGRDIPHMIFKETGNIYTIITH